MKQVLLDTNFILTCIKEKIDFFQDIPLMGIPLIIPEQVIKELKNLKEKSALKLLEIEASNFKKIELQGKNVDNAIVQYAKDNPETIIATLDKEIQNKIRNKKMVIRNKKKIEII